MSGPVRPEPDESTLSDADLWEAKVAQGMPKDSATAYVRNRTRNVSFSDVRGGSSSRAAPEIDADRAAFTRGGGSSFGEDPSQFTDNYTEALQQVIEALAARYSPAHRAALATASMMSYLAQGRSCSAPVRPRRR